MRTGILTATLNPLHLGHISILRAATQILNLDRIYAVIGIAPVGKSNTGMASASIRTVIARIGIEEAGDLRHCKVELATLPIIPFRKRLHDQLVNGGDDVWLIAGGDKIQKYDAGYYRDLPQGIMFARAGYETESEALTNARGWILEPDPGQGYSASQVRKAVEGGNQAFLRQMLSPGQIEYINRYRIYGQGRLDINMLNHPFCFSPSGV